MAFKFIVLAAFVAAARAGDLGYAAAPALAYSSAPAVSYSNIHTPAVAYNAPAVAKIAAPVSYAAPLSYSAPVSYAAPAPVAYHAPAPVAYHAPAPVAYAAPVAKTVVAEQYAPAQYDFGYSVSDPHTGDSKSQQESRHGDVVQGSYSLVDADGTKRTVEYTADPHNGFNAVVHKEPLSAPVVAKVAAPVTYAAPAPVVAKYAAAPAVTVAKYAAATPLAYAAAAQPAYYH